MEKIEIIPETIKVIKLTDEEYFSVPEYRDYISNSKLGLLNPEEGGSLEKYLTGFSSDYSDSFALGSAVHAMILQPDFFTISDLRKPGGKLGLFAEKVFEFRKQGLTIQDAIIKASEDANYYSGKLSPTRLKTAIRSSLPFYIKRLAVQEDIDKKTLYLSDTIATKYEQCVTGVLSDSKIMGTLFPQGLLSPAEVFNEYAIFAEVNVTLEDDRIIRLKIKAKLDNYTINHETQELTLNDLKTTGKPIGFFMGNWVKGINPETGLEDKIWYDGSFQKFHYYRQMGMYLWMLSCAIKHLNGINYDLKANMLVVETIPEFRSRIYSVSGTQIKKGLEEFKKLLILVAKNE